MIGSVLEVLITKETEIVCGLFDAPDAVTVISPV